MPARPGPPVQARAAGAAAVGGGPGAGRPVSLPRARVAERGAAPTVDEQDRQHHRDQAGERHGPAQPERTRREQPDRRSNRRDWRGGRRERRGGRRKLALEAGERDFDGHRPARRDRRRVVGDRRGPAPAQAALDDRLPLGALGREGQRHDLAQVARVRVGGADEHPLEIHLHVRGGLVAAVGIGIERARADRVEARRAGCRPTAAPAAAGPRRGGRRSRPRSCRATCGGRPASPRASRRPRTGRRGDRSRRRCSCSGAM